MLEKLQQHIKNNQKLKQILGLLSVNVINIPIGIIVSALLARMLGPQFFGDYKFIISIYNIGGIIFILGFYYSGNRALVLSKIYATSQEYYGAMLFITGGLYVSMTVFLLIYAKKRSRYNLASTI
jgi:O-antigen/teichoic acid export membrane protein